jgi:hypothetical protein
VISYNLKKLIRIADLILLFPFRVTILTFLKIGSSHICVYHPDPRSHVRSASSLAFLQFYISIVAGKRDSFLFLPFLLLCITLLVDGQSVVLCSFAFKTAFNEGAKL